MAAEGRPERKILENMKGPLETPLSERVERETGFEPATSTLARWRSTTELFPQNQNVAPYVVADCERRDLNPHAKAPDPKSGVSANSTILAFFGRLKVYLGHTGVEPVAR